jgi:ketosteroid isomerase-like protein
MLIDVNEFGEWLYSDCSGEVVYFTGEWLCDACKKEASSDASDRTHALVRQMAWDSHVNGRVNLVQRKIAPRVYQYIAQKNPLSARASLALRREGDGKYEAVFRPRRTNKRREAA